MKKILLVLFLVISMIIFIFLKIDQRSGRNLLPTKSNSENTETAGHSLNDYENFQGTSTSLHNGWMLYKNETLGFQVEYPDRKFTYGVLKSNEAKLKNAEQSLSYNISLSDGDSSRIMVTMEQAGVRTVDEWFMKEMAQYKFYELGELYYKKIKISGLDAVLTYQTVYDPSVVFTDEQIFKKVVVMKDGILIMIATAYLREEERERIWKSFQFL